MTQDLTEFHGTPCLNCGSTLTGNFCANCGQRATDVNLSVRTLAVEFVESLFSLEFGFWQTFKRLVLFPGTLTSEYIAGRRKRYSSPVKLYLGTSLVFFFLINFLGGNGGTVKINEDDGSTKVLTGKEAVEAMQHGFADALGDSAAGAAADSSVAAAMDRIPGGEKAEKFLKDPEAQKKRFMSYLPRAMFFMVPLSALLFRLVYVRHKRPYLHYLVFSLHLHALFYFTFSLVGLLGRIPPDGLGDGLALAAMTTFPVNVVRAQRRAFGDPWWKAALKACIVWNLYGFFLSLTITAVILAMIFLG